MIIYGQTYLAENLNRAEMLDIIRESYFPMLVREFVKWQRANGRKMTKADVELFSKDNAVMIPMTSILINKT
jgi:hypothetical protein